MKILHEHLQRSQFKYELYKLCTVSTLDECTISERGQKLCVTFCERYVDSIGLCFFGYLDSFFRSLLVSFGLFRSLEVSLGLFRSLLVSLSPFRSVYVPPGPFRSLQVPSGPFRFLQVLSGSFRFHLLLLLNQHQHWFLEWTIIVDCFSSV